ncbi:glycoside hydrolase family 73 protein, partial [Porphyromonas loveana]
MRAKILQVFFVSLFLCFGIFSAVAQGRNRTYEAYVKQYADEAIRQMSRYNIPASITMAQALVETGAGASTLASVHNNHFGIKCHRSWTGKRTYRTDDAPDECFRSYSHSRESYEDHSRFLLQPRYRSLFDLRRDDYRGWATGLQRCGYATNRGYANLLIKMVEVY